MPMRNFFCSHLLVLMVMLSLCAHARGSSWETPGEVCQILDRPAKPVWNANMALIPARRFSGYGKTEFIEFDGSAEIAYYRDVLMGDIDVDVGLALSLFPDSAGLQFPDQLMWLAADAGWTWRYVNGAALQVRVAPGIYSDAEEISSSAFSMPLSVAGVYIFNSSLSGTAGLQLRPGWELAAMPIVGVAWEISNQVRLEAMLPESRLVVAVDDLLQLHAGFAWNNTTYAIKEKGSYDRKHVTLEDYRTSVGATYLLVDELHLVGELGYVYKREVEFDRVPSGSSNDASIDSTPYVRFGIAGPF